MASGTGNEMSDSPKHWPAMSLEKAHALLMRSGGGFEIEEISIRGVKTRVWKYAPSSLRDLFLRARGFGTREFLIHGKERVTFEAFARASLAIAAELCRHGVRKGDRVALAMRNLPEWPTAFFGAVLAGAIVTPLNAWWTPGEMEYGLNDSGAKIAFVDAERFACLDGRLSHCSALEHLYISRFDGALPSTKVSRLEDVTGIPSDWHGLPEGKMPDIALAPDDDVSIFYTSGTTAQSKGVLGTHRNMLSSIPAMSFAMARDVLRRGRPVPASEFLVSPQRAVLLAIPLFHVTGCFTVLGPALYIGAKLVLMRKWDPEKAFALIESEKIAQVSGVPANAWQMLESPARAKYDLSSLRLVTYGGAPSTPSLAPELRRVFPRSYPGSGWGMTETSAICTNHSGEDFLHRPDSCGPAVPVCDLKVMDLEGTVELATGEVGELWVRGPNVVKGYWNRPEETAEVFAGGWVRTGDLAHLDEEGFCTIVDRAKDMLIRGGENIYCSEVENVLRAHPAVADAAVVAIAHHALGEEPGAVVRLREGLQASEADLRAFAGERLSPFKVPVRIAFSAEPLPRNAGGKLVRSELKNIFA